MKKRILLCRFIILLMVLSLFTGCWNAKEISELSIATGLGIDKNDNGQYIVTVQLINPGEVEAQKASGRAEVTTYKITASSIYEALRKLTVEVPRRIYLAHMQIVILGEKIAKEGIKECIDFLERDHEFRSDFYLLIAKGSSPHEIFNVLTPMQKVPAISMYTQLETSEKLWAPTVLTNLDTLIADLIARGKDAVITGVTIIGDSKSGGSKSGLETTTPSALIRLNGVGVFRKDQLVGWLNQNESKGLNYILSRVKRTVGPGTCPDGGKFIVEVEDVKTKIKAKFKNGKPVIALDMKVQETVGEVQCSIDLTKPESITQLEKIAEERIIKIAQQSVNQAKEFHSDIFGFGEAIHREYPKEWKKLQKNWHETFPELHVEYKVNVDIRRVGTITNSIFDQVKE